MKLKLYWDETDDATIIFELDEVHNHSLYAQTLVTLQKMVEERDQTTLLITYTPKYVLHYDGFTDSAKQFYQLMHDYGLWHVVVVSRNQALIDLWQSTLSIYKVEPPTYSLVSTIDAAIEHIIAKREN